jgi:hypothetical protein
MKRGERVVTIVRRDAMDENVSSGAPIIELRWKMVTTRAVSPTANALRHMRARAWECETARSVLA